MAEGSGTGAAGDGGGKVGVPVGAGAQRRGEIDFLVDRVDDAAGLGIGQHEVEEADRGRGVAQQRMIDGVQLAVGAAVAGIVQQLASVRGIGVGDDVVVLEVVGGGSDRQVVVDVRFRAEDAAHVGQELPGIPVADLPPHLERHVGSSSSNAGAEAAHGIDHHLRGGEQAQLVADGAEVGLDLARLGLRAAVSWL